MSCIKFIPSYDKTVFKKVELVLCNILGCFIMYSISKEIILVVIIVFWFV